MQQSPETAAAPHSFQWDSVHFTFHFSDYHLRISNLFTINIYFQYFIALKIKTRNKTFFILLSVQKHTLLPNECPTQIKGK